MIRYGAIVEITRHADGMLPTALIAAAYRASAAAPILLVLRDVEVETIDRILDPLVANASSPVQGVVYVDAADESRITAAARQARFAVPTTQSLSLLLASMGLANLSGDELEATLTSPRLEPRAAIANPLPVVGGFMPAAARA